MQRYSPLLLSVWREVGRHRAIAESVERVGQLLEGRTPAEVMLIRQIDRERSCLETLAASPCRAEVSAPRSRTECSAEQLERVEVWCRQGRVTQLSAQAAHQEIPGLVPPGLSGEVLAGPLSARVGAAGLLLLAAGPGQPFEPEHVELADALLEPLAVALENDHRVRELVALREALEADKRSLLSRLGREDLRDTIVGAETGLRVVMQQVELVARSAAPVLILGETGAGKEVVARAIHTRSPRAGKPFLRVNCGAIPPELLDSELFGHERGSFTGAVSERKGWFERADGGTLFLDECGELPPAAQVRLLRVLQDGTFERVGGERQLRVDVRIVAATHRDLPQLVAEGRFREDLWYRIAVFPVRLPALRERREDIPALAAHFALRAARRLGIMPLTPTAEDVRLLQAYPWPGNVRELSAVMERAAILGDGKYLDVARALGVAAPAAPAPGPPASGDPSAPLPRLDAVMANHIQAALLRTRGRIEGPHGAARLLGINPHTLRARMRKLEVDWQRFRDRPPPESPPPSPAA
jgi:transcriptional regulator with GAF, ATPase, and Fis domain